MVIGFLSYFICKYCFSFFSLSTKNNFHSLVHFRKNVLPFGRINFNKAPFLLIERSIKIFLSKKKTNYCFFLRLNKNFIKKIKLNLPNEKKRKILGKFTKYDVTL